MINGTSLESSAVNNETYSGSTSVIYFGVNGYGITWSYFLTHIVLIIIAGTGIFLNTMALQIVKIKSPFSDVSQIFISHLAMSDIFTGVICIYVALYNLIHYKNYYECAFRTGITTCLNLNSVIHLLSLTFDRYFKIMYPYKYVQLFTEKRMKVFSCCIWIFAAILGLLPILGWRRPPIRGLTYCSYFGVLETKYLTLMCVIFFSILLTMLYCYFSIICVAWNQRKRVIDRPRDRKTTYDYRNTKDLWWAPTKTVIILITFYSCCWLPTGTVVLLHLFDVFPSSYTDDTKGELLAYVSAFIFLDIIANPIIYAFKIRRVKRRIRCMINNISSEGRTRPCKPSLDSDCQQRLSLNIIFKSGIKSKQEFKNITFSDKLLDSTGVI